MSSFLEAEWYSTICACHIFISFKKKLFIYFWLLWVFLAAHRLSLVGASGSYFLLQCVDSVVGAHGFCCSVACGIFPHQGSNPCPLHWQVDSSPWTTREVPCYILCIHLPIDVYLSCFHVPSMWPTLDFLWLICNPSVAKELWLGNPGLFKNNCPISDPHQGQNSKFYCIA